MPYPRHNPPDWKGLIEWPVRLFNEGQYALCIADCRTLLLYSIMPLWWRIRCQLLLAASLEDWDEAEEVRVKAETLWTHCRVLYRDLSGVKSYRTELIEEMREILDKLAKDMKHGRPTEGEFRFTGNTRRKYKDAWTYSVAAPADYAAFTTKRTGASTVKATAQTALPTHRTTTLTVRSRDAAEGDDAAVRNDSAFKKSTSQDRLTASTNHDQDYGHADGATISDLCVHDQDSTSTDNDVTMSDQ